MKNATNTPYILYMHARSSAVVCTSPTRTMMSISIVQQMNHIPSIGLIDQGNIDVCVYVYVYANRKYRKKQRHISCCGDEMGNSTLVACLSKWSKWKTKAPNSVLRSASETWDLTKKNTTSNTRRFFLQRISFMYFIFRNPIKCFYDCCYCCWRCWAVCVCVSIRYAALSYAILVGYLFLILPSHNSVRLRLCFSWNSNEFFCLCVIFPFSSSPLFCFLWYYFFFPLFVSFYYSFERIFPASPGSSS